MEKLVLKNGMTLILDKRPSKVLTSMLTIKCGSNYEDDVNNGISHVLEHCVFNGTKKRKAFDIANSIEKLGGELNAATSCFKTFFFTKTLSKHIDVALDVLSDIFYNPLFPLSQFKKEKGVVSQEISMVYDNYDHFQWVVFQKHLFLGPQSRPIYGTKENVLGFSRQLLIDYYKAFYQPRNAILTLSGGIPFNTKQIAYNFFGKELGKPPKVIALPDEPKQVQKIWKENLPVNSAYLILGYKIPVLGTKEAIVFEIINAILSRGQSGMLFENIRNKKGLAYSVGSHHFMGIRYNFFAAYANTQEKNIETVKNAILLEFGKLKNISENTLKEAKTFLEGDYYVSKEDGISHSDWMTNWEIAGDIKKAEAYLREVNRISKKDVINAVNKYLTKDYCMTILLPKQGQV